jgi:hypothetical protein
VNYPAFVGPTGPGRTAAGTPVRREDVREAAPESAAPLGTCAALPGYRFVSCLGRHASGESWVVQLPDGRTRLARFVHGFGELGPTQEREALQRLTSLAHPVLLPVRIAHADPGRVILLCELPGSCARDRLAQCRAEGLSGIPRPELLACLEAVAEALDQLRQEFSLQHLGLNPSTVLLERGRVLLQDFGLAHLLWLPAGQPVARFNARYAAPELFDGRVGPSSDQYSLAILYVELLTGLHPLPSQAPLRSAADVLRYRPDTRLFSAGERDVLGRALSPEPKLRFPRCLDLVRALVKGRPRKEKAPPAGLICADLPPIIAMSAEPVLPPPPAGVSLPPLNEVLPQLIASAAGPVEVQEHEGIRFQILPGNHVQHRCAAWLPVGVAGLRLESFCREWGAVVVHAGEDRFVCHLLLPGTLWQRYLRRRVGLELQVALRQPSGLALKLTQVEVVLRPLGCGESLATRLLWEAAPRLLASLRTHLQACPEQRTEPRLLCEHPLQVSLVRPGLRLEAPLECPGKDISWRGVGFFLQDQPASPEVYLTLPAETEGPGLGVLARIVRVRPRGDGWYEVGAAFPRSEPRLLR